MLLRLSPFQGEALGAFVAWIAFPPSGTSYFGSARVTWKHAGEVCCFRLAWVYGGVGAAFHPYGVRSTFGGCEGSGEWTVVLFNCNLACRWRCSCGMRSGWSEKKEEHVARFKLG
ncbi:hypothetical protein GCM10010913_35100 [Paenibacillus aceti]|uniref:Secreted protein n=1 Tax=Paenibacillus aceti TaxID=1820010 RepID=A0ABQ1W2F5_9BACL|nr:hypothetical protein GCM10010913_35100 [Paenibacillus aceti]